MKRLVLTMAFAAFGTAFTLAQTANQHEHDPDKMVQGGGKLPAGWQARLDNSGAKLPSTGIQVIHRSDGSGTTAALTAYLTAVAPTVWTAGSGKDVPWPTGQGAKGSEGVTAAVKQTPGAIGYSEVSFPKSTGLGIAKRKPTTKAVVRPAVATRVSSERAFRRRITVMSQTAASANVSSPR